MAIKKTNYTPYLIALAVAGVGAYVYRDKIKEFFAPEKTDEGSDAAKVATDEGKTVQQTLITSGGMQTIKAPISTELSPIGTPKDKLNLNVYLKKGMKGQEVAKLQQILNAISNITGKAKVDENGIFGDGTEARLSNMFGNIDKINLFKMYTALFAINAADQNKKPKKWFDFYSAYLTDKDRYNVARKLYFDKNPIL